jgi:hypothetical protein
MTLKELHAALQDAFDTWSRAYERGELPLTEIGADTALALGYAMGSISKAKALIGRDIDDNARKGFGA